MKRHKTTIDDRWSGLQGERDDAPFMARVRQLRLHSAVKKAFTHLFALEWSYPVSGRRSMPTQAFYRRMERFESIVIDTLEGDGEGVLVFVETCAGTVRYLLYVRDPQTMADRVKDFVEAGALVTLSSRRDREWSEYQAIRRAFLTKPRRRRL